MFLQGRTNRATYAAQLVAAALVLAIFSRVASGHTLSVLISVLLLVAAPRLHDTGRSAWWLAIPLALALAATWAAQALLPEPSAEKTSDAVGPFFAGMALALGFIRGTPGANRFAPPPPPGVNTRRPRPAAKTRTAA